MWNLAGTEIPWPGHISLSPEQRCNCQCTLTIEFGMNEEEAQQEIEEYWNRVGETKGLKTNPYHDEHGRFAPGRGVHMAPSTGGEGAGSGAGGIEGKPERFSDNERDKWEASLSKEQKIAVNSWMMNGYKEMREADKDGTVSENLENFKKAIETAPLRRNEVHRGIRADLKAKVGDEIELNAMSSFSTNRAVAKDFAVGDPTTGKYVPKSRRVTIISVDKHQGAAVLPMKSVGGSYETEAVMEKGRTFRVMRVEIQTIKKQPGGRSGKKREWKATILHVEEVGQKSLGFLMVLKDIQTGEVPSSRFADEDSVYITVVRRGEKHLSHDQSTHGRGGGGSGGSSRSEIAKRTHKPSTAKKQRRAEGEQARLATLVKGWETDDNDAFDVILGKAAVEVKCVMDNNNNKITMHPKSRRRKEKFAEDNGMTSHTVAIDVRGGKRVYYHRASVGAFRLTAMDKVSVAELRERLG